MPRSRRISFPGAWYHVFNRGISKKSITFSEKHRYYFLTLLHDLTEKFNIEIHSYCLMSNHYHLLVHTPDGNISKAMHYFGTCFGMLVNKDTNSDGAVFKGRYNSVVIDSTSHLLQVSRYIHLNPVAANLVECPEDYEWSSFKYYMNDYLKSSFLKKHEVLGQVAKKEDYLHFVHEGVDRETEKFYSSKKIKSIF